MTLARFEVVITSRHISFLKKAALHEDRIQPPPELEANVFQQTCIPKAEAPVQIYGGLVAAVADDRNHLMHAARLGCFDESGHQQPARARAQAVGPDID